jgi:putative FmdB family regulatory protein
MPIYEYECRSCGGRFEYLALPATPEPVCPSCQSRDLEQLLSLFSTSTAQARQSYRKEMGQKRKAHQHDRMQTEQRIRNED